VIFLYFQNQAQNNRRIKTIFDRSVLLFLL